MSTDAGKTCSRESDAAAAVPLPDRLLFFVLLAILCARPLISESFERLGFSFLPADIPNGTTLAATVWLDGMLLVTAALVWIRRLRSGPRTGIVSIGLSSLLAAIIVSVVVANDKRLAANAGAHLFVMALAAAALVRVTRARWMAHLLIAAVLASGVTNAAKCVSQQVYEFDQLREYWEEQKPALAERGLDLNSPTIVNYGRRLHSAEAFGYLSHPNVTASCLAMCLVVAAGVFVGVLRKPGLDANRRAATALVAGGLGAVLTVGLWLTASTGAAVTAALASLLLLALGVARGWIAAHARGAFGLLVLGYVGIITAGAGYGLLKGTLPHTSLAFRWHYWQATARTLADTPLTGIGRENFRAAYLLHKSPESTEEVANPHNVWLSLLVELGPLGLIAGTLLLGTAVGGALRSFAEAGRNPPARFGIGVLVAAAVGVLLVQALFSGEQFSAPGIPLLWATLVAGVWTLAFVSAYLLVSQVDEHRDTSVWLIAGLSSALCAALIHNLIGFSLFTPAGLSVFVVLAASAVALRRAAPRNVKAEDARASASRRAGFADPIALIVLIAAYAWLVAIPTLRAEAARRRINAELRAAPDHVQAYDVLDRGLAALRLDRWDADMALDLAETTLQLEIQTELPAEVRQDWIHLADAYARSAEWRNPRSFATREVLARILQRQAETTGRADLRADITSHWDDAVALYPTNPRTRIEAGKAWFQLWRRTDQASDARQALAHFDAALAIDATRLPEVAVKLRPAELEVIRRHLAALRAAGFESAAARAPASEPSP